MILKSGAKFEQKPICCFKNDKKLVNFDPGTQNSNKLQFGWSLSCKVYNVDLKKYRGVIIHDTEKSCKIESCKNWLVVWKITWRNWQMTRELENLKYLHFNGLLLTKVYNVWAKKVQRSYVWWHWILMENLKENLTCVFKNDMRNLANFHWKTFESLKIGTLMESFYPK